MTGAELRAWRERLGKDEAWGAGVCSSYVGVAGPVPACSVVASERRRDVEGEARRYAADDLEAMRAAYTAALEAEEARQAAEHGPVEPVCPEGVTAWVSSTKGVMISMSPDQSALVHVLENGSIAPLWTYGRENLSPALLEYTAALSRHRAALHAASDKQRKLDAVRAAEEAHDAAHKATEDAYAAYREAEAACGQTHKALKAARREAGL